MGVLQHTVATRVYIWVVVFGGLAAISESVYRLAIQPVDLRWLLLAALTLVSGSANLRLTKVSATISVSETFVFTSVLLFGAAAGTLTVALEAFVLSVSLKRRRKTALYRVLFNIAAPALSIWAAGHLFFWLAGKPPLSGYAGVVRIVDVALPLLAFTLAYFLLNSWLIAIAISLAERVSALAIWRDNLLWLLLNYFGGASVAALLVGYRGTFDVALLLVIAPILLVLHFTMKTVLGRVEDTNQHLARVNSLYLSTIETLANAIDAKDQVTHGHIRRVQHFATALARHAGVREDAQIKAIEAAALLHDMGKLAVPDYILNKPGPLSEAEFGKMKRHAELGAEILSAINFPYPVVPIVRHHHEHWDGSGYPDGLKGTEIPIGARILSVVDCFDALTSDRPYRPRLEVVEAFRILKERRGRMYDPLIVDTFIEKYTLMAEDAVLTSTDSETPALVAIAESGAIHNRDRTHMTANWAPAGTTASLRAQDIAAELPAGDMSIVLFQRCESDDLLKATSAVGFAADFFTQTTAALTERVVGWVAANATSIYNADARLDGPAQRSLGTCTAVPVIERGSVVGVLAVYTYGNRRLTAEELLRIEILTGTREPAHPRTY